VERLRPRRETHVRNLNPFCFDVREPADVERARRGSHVRLTTAVRSWRERKSSNALFDLRHIAANARQGGGFVRVLNCREHDSRNRHENRHGNQTEDEDAPALIS
jgi:hypothetical protein